MYISTETKTHLKIISHFLVTNLSYLSFVLGKYVVTVNYVNYKWMLGEEMRMMNGFSIKTEHVDPGKTLRLNLFTWK